VTTTYLIIIIIIIYSAPFTVKTRGCNRWEAARYRGVFAVKYVCAVLGLSRSVCSCGRGYRPSHRNTI